MVYDGAVPSTGKTGAPARGPLPFDAKSVGKNIEELRVHLDIPVDDIWPKVGISSRTHWYAKVAGTKPFRWEEAAKIAREFGASKGFPILTWREALKAEQDLEGR
jgi:hypothetical protein